MLLRIIVISIVMVISAGCSSSKIITGDPATAKMVLLPPSYSEGTNVNVVNECLMLQEVKSSFLTYSNSYSANSVASNEASKIRTDQFSIMLQFENVASNAFSIHSFRPISEATLVVSIMKNGELVDKVSKNINSKMAFTACGRLEKIAKTSGKYAAKWLRKKGY